MSNETRKCECGGTMHHSSDMDDPFPGEGEGRPFFQCEMCGECVDDGPNETDRPTPSSATADTGIWHGSIDEHRQPDECLGESPRYGSAKTSGV